MKPLLFLKFLIITLLLALSGSMLSVWFSTFILGAYWATGTIFAIFVVGVLIPVVVVYATVFAIIAIWKL